jgi:sugar/nucleoside kinase (ribokinase family)
MKLFPEIHPYFSHRLGFANHPIATLVPYALMTFGIEGMAAHWKGRYVYAPAVELDPDLIVNTSGAGDTAAGGFVAGIVEKRDPVEVLASCTSLASDVLRTHSSRLLQSPDPGK